MNTAPTGIPPATVGSQSPRLPTQSTAYLTPSKRGQRGTDTLAAESRKIQGQKPATPIGRQSLSARPLPHARRYTEPSSTSAKQLTSAQATTCQACNGRHRPHTCSLSSANKAPRMLREMLKSLTAPGSAGPSDAMMSTRPGERPSSVGELSEEEGLSSDDGSGSDGGDGGDGDDAEARRTAAPALRQLQTLWVQCDACRKWRRLPSRVSSDDDVLLETWTCALNPDPRRASCSAPQESQSVGETAVRWASFERRPIMEEVVDHRGVLRRKCGSPGCTLWAFHPGLCTGQTLPAQRQRASANAKYADFAAH